MNTFVLLALAAAPVVLGVGAQALIGRRFDETLAVPAANGLTGAEVATRLAAGVGLAGTTVETAGEGERGDHYDASSRVIRLSQQIAASRSVGAQAVAAHEVGHAIQHAVGNRGFRLRGALVPAAIAGHYGWAVVLCIGVYAQSVGLVVAAFVLFSAVLGFHLVTLPVEFDASGRAISMLTEAELLRAEELPVARRLLTAAALTYVAVALAAAADLAWLILSLEDE
jgi:uncharacterized protein